LDSASLPFILFGLIGATLSNRRHAPKWRSAVLFVCSVAFIAVLVPSLTAALPLAGFLVLGFLGLVLLQHGFVRLRSAILFAVVLAYVWLKKYTFLPPQAFLAQPYTTLGLSYIFFRVLRVLIETGDAGRSQRIGLFRYLLYTLNFTTFVSGPIQSYDDFARDQFAPEPISLGPRMVGLQLERIVRGFFKVNVLAALLIALQQDALVALHEAVPTSVRVVAAVEVISIYPLFLYSNFSGYIDIVIAIARLMRLRLPENFDRPFSSACFLEFWSRWHITLSGWLKTFVYNPLLKFLMSRTSSLPMQQFFGVLCFFVTFFLVGLWHGRTSEFVVFGALQGGGVAINKIWQLGMTAVLGRRGYRSLAKNPVYVALARGLTFAWFGATLFWFWGSWDQINRAFASLAWDHWLAAWLAVWGGATVVLALWEWIRKLLTSVRAGGAPVLNSRFARVAFATALALGSFVMTGILNQPAPEIIYKAF